MTKRHFISYFFFFFLFFIIPGVAFAGSCGCVLKPNAGGENVKTCSGSNIMEEQDCENILKIRPVLFGQYAGKYEYVSCAYFENEASCVANFQMNQNQSSLMEDWWKALNTALSQAGTSEDGITAREGSSSTTQKDSGTSAILPTCALDGDCRNVNALLQLAINIGQYIFSIIGSVAFVVFIYGGFTVVTSFGNSEKVKKGYGILSAGVIGLAIAFGAYILIDFVLDALQVQEGFRVIQ